MIDKLIHPYVSPYETYFNGKKLFDRLALINATCSDLYENFTENNDEIIPDTIVYKNNEFVIYANSKVFDILLKYVIKNPQVKITYYVENYIKITFKFKADKKRDQFINLNFGDIECQ